MHGLKVIMLSGFQYKIDVQFHFPHIYEKE